MGLGEWIVYLATNRTGRWSDRNPKPIPTSNLNAQGRDTGLALFYAALSSQFHFLDLGAKKPYIAITSRAKALPGGRPIH